MRLFFACVVAAILAGCASGTGPRTAPEPVTRTTPIPYSLDAGGIQLAGRAQRVDFGRTAHSTERAMTKLVGQAPVDRGICADGRPKVTWADGTVLYFSGGAFRGWSKLGAEGRLQTAGATCG